MVTFLPLVGLRAVRSVLLYMHTKEADICSVNVLKCKKGFCPVWERLWHLSTVHKSEGKTRVCKFTDCKIKLNSVIIANNLLLLTSTTSLLDKRTLLSKLYQEVFKCVSPCLFPKILAFIILKNRKFLQAKRPKKCLVIKSVCSTSFCTGKERCLWLSLTVSTSSTWTSCLV